MCLQQAIFASRVPIPVACHSVYRSSFGNGRTPGLGGSGGALIVRSMGRPTDPRRPTSQGRDNRRYAQVEESPCQ
jgi:hypothetical protein